MDFGHGSYPHMPDNVQLGGTDKIDSVVDESTPELIVETIDDRPESSQGGQMPVSEIGDSGIQIGYLHGNQNNYENALSEDNCPNKEKGKNCGSPSKGSLHSKKAPPNEIVPGGKPKIKLIDAGHISKYQIPSSGSGEGSASGINEAEQTLKEIYSNKTESEYIGEDETASQYDGDNVSKQKETERENILAEQIVEDEDDGDNGYNGELSMKHSPDNLAKQKAQSNTNLNSYTTINAPKKNKKPPKVRQSHGKTLGDSNRVHHQLPSNSNRYIQQNGTNGHVGFTSKSGSIHKSRPKVAGVKLKSGKQSTRKNNEKTVNKMAYSKHEQKHRSRRNSDYFSYGVPFTGPSSRILFSDPFWNVKSDRSITSTRSIIPMRPHRQALMKGMIQKRWKIPGTVLNFRHDSFLV